MGRTLKSYLRGILDFGVIVLALARFRRTRQNSEKSYQSLLRLFCLTGGASNDVLTNFLRQKETSSDLPARGVLGDLDEPECRHIQQNLEQKGYYVFPQRLSPEFCDSLLRFAAEQPGWQRRMDHQDPTQWKREKTLFRRESPEAVRFDYEPEDLLKSETVQKLIADPSILRVAQDYLGGEPILDIVTMWWHTNFSRQPDSEAAQFYHFDMDRVKWLKFFFYLTDVGPENGPHKFVRGSHQTGGIPSELLKRGYERIRDEEVAAHFQPQDEIVFTGPRGTIIAEDTRGLHKGQHVHHGDRLVFQLEFAVSLFGAPYRPIRMPSETVPELKDRLRERPTVYSMFQSSPSGS